MLWLILEERCTSGGDGGIGDHLIRRNFWNGFRGRQNELQLGNCQSLPFLSRWRSAWLACCPAESLGAEFN
jgi:hypothetical protein